MAGCTRLYSLVCSFSLVSFARLVRTLIRVGNHFFAVLLGMAVLRSPNLWCIIISIISIIIIAIIIIFVT